MMQHVHPSRPGRRIAALLSASVAALVLSTGPARGGGYLVDQAYEPEIFGSWSIRFFGPAGQEFVPQRSSLNVVELWINHGASSMEPPADVFVRLRAGAIDGPVLGTSAPVTVQDEWFAPVRFDFGTPIALTPGNTYVIEAVVVETPGAGNPLVCGGDQPGYPPGRAVVNGSPNAGIDLWFRTGATPEVPAAEGSWGAVKALYR